MCGRFALKTPAVELVELFRLLGVPRLELRFNIAPTQQVAVVRRVGAARELSMLHWGLIPSWAKDPKSGAPMINARCETVDSKPSFRSAFRSRRCLIPADGFFEWKKTGSRTKQPFYITLDDERPFAFAGLWEEWTGPGGSTIESCTIITTEANHALRDIHDRMPVILLENAYDCWLDEKPKNAKNLLPLLVPFPAEQTKFRAVSAFVNNARNDSPECLRPAEQQKSLFDEP